MLGYPTGGAWTVSFDGYTTAPLAHNVTANNLTIALQALGSIGANNAAVTKTGTEYAVEFRGELTAAPQALCGVASALTGGTLPHVEVSRWATGTGSADAFGQYLTVGYKRDSRGLTDWAPGYVLNLQRAT